MAVEGLELEGDAADGPILLARGNLAYFTGDIDQAWSLAAQARAMLQAPDSSSSRSSSISFEPATACP